MREAPYLQKGDTVGILSTARFISLEAIQPAINLLARWGLKVRVGKTIGMRQDQMAGSDAEKVADLQSMLDDPEVAAIWCAKGGYGTARLLDNLDFSSFTKNPKWICGFSDITALHMHLQMILRIASIHSIMPSTLATASAESISSLKDALFGDALSYECEGHPLNNTGTVEAPIVGGNLSLIYSQQGNSNALRSAKCILFLEDLDEYLYHIDRMIVNLKRSGTFGDLAGLLIGGMNDMNDNPIPFGQSAEEIIAEHTSNFAFPIAYGFPAGHSNINNTLKLGVSAKLDVSKKHTQLSFH